MKIFDVGSFIFVLILFIDFLWLIQILIPIVPFGVKAVDSE